MNWLQALFKKDARQCAFCRKHDYKRNLKYVDDSVGRRWCYYHQDCLIEALRHPRDPIFQLATRVVMYRKEMKEIQEKREEAAKEYLQEHV